MRRWLNQFGPNKQKNKENLYQCIKI